MSALETAVGKLDDIRNAIASGKMKKGSDLWDLPTLDRGDVVIAYLAENPERFDDCCEDIETTLLGDIMQKLAERDYTEAGRILALCIPNTPAGGDILAHVQSKAEDFIAQREAENRYEAERLSGAVVYLRG